MSADDAIAILLEMFPDIDVDVAMRLLEINQYDVQAVIDHFLNPSNVAQQKNDTQSSHPSDSERGPASDPSAVIRLLVLVGLPGSGKSTLSRQFASAGWTVVCQDELGNRHACEAEVDAALRQGDRVVVDRTNVDAPQRAHWLRIAAARGLSPHHAAALHLDYAPSLCIRRVLSRAAHPTLPAAPASADVVRSFRACLRRPRRHEGFGWVATAHCDAEAAVAAAALLGTVAGVGGGGVCVNGQAVGRVVALRR